MYIYLLNLWFRFVDCRSLRYICGLRLDDNDMISWYLNEYNVYRDFLMKQNTAH